MYEMTSFHSRVREPQNSLISILSFPLPHAARLFSHLSLSLSLVRRREDGSEPTNILQVGEGIFTGGNLAHSRDIVFGMDLGELNLTTKGRRSSGAVVLEDLVARVRNC
jgi:hypothetical protein